MDALAWLLVLEGERNATEAAAQVLRIAATPGARRPAAAPDLGDADAWVLGGSRNWPADRGDGDRGAGPASLRRLLPAAWIGLLARIR